MLIQEINSKYELDVWTVFTWKSFIPDALSHYNALCFTIV